MITPARTLRAQAEAIEGPPEPVTEADQEAALRIIFTGAELIAQNGRHAVTVATLAHALRMRQATIRRLFSDMDGVLGAILRHHLQAVAQAVANASPDQTARQGTAARAAYLAETRGPDGALYPAHELLIHQRHALPPDLLAEIEEARDSLARTLAGPQGQAAMALLDSPWLDAEQIELMLIAARAAKQISAQAARAQPAPAETAPAQAASNQTKSASPPAGLRIAPPLCDDLLGTTSHRVMFMPGAPPAAIIPPPWLTEAAPAHRDRPERARAP